MQRNGSGVNCRRYTQGYYLADAIYPKWAATIPERQEASVNCFLAVRKDVECAFDGLQARWVWDRPDRVGANSLSPVLPKSTSGITQHASGPFSSAACPHSRYKNANMKVKDCF